MANIIEWFERKAGDEPIIACVIGDYGWGWADSEENVAVKDVKGKVVSWDEAKKYLDYEFDNGYGGENCHAVFAWTENWMIFISQYDGSTRCNTIPRNPVDCIPHMPGG